MPLQRPVVKQSYYNLLAHLLLTAAVELASTSFDDTPSGEVAVGLSVECVRLEVGASLYGAQTQLCLPQINCAATLDVVINSHKSRQLPLSACLLVELIIALANVVESVLQ